MRRQDDLAALVLVSVLAILAVAADVPIVRDALAILAVLVAPGAAATALVFPHRGALRPLERGALALAASLAIAAGVALALGVTPWRIRALPVVVVLAVVTAALAYLAARRRVEETRWSLPRPRRRASRAWGAVDLALVVLVVAAAALAGWAGAHAARTPVEPAPYTTFYVLGPDGLLDAYPKEMRVGVPAQLRVGVASYEDAPTRYDVRLDALVDGATQSVDAWSIELAPRERWEEARSFTLAREGATTLVWTLSRGAEAEYRTLRLHVNVTAPPAPDARAEPTFTWTVEANRVYVDGTGSLPGAAQIVEWRWFWGDGGEGRGSTADHGYKEPGTYVVSLVVRDANGREALHSARVVVPPF